MGDSVEPDPGTLGDALDEVVAVLADKRRRYVLHYLVVTEDPVTITELSAEIAEWGARDRGTARTTLVHHHLPKLVDSGLVHVDRDGGTIVISEKGERADQVRSACLEGVLTTCT